MKTESYIAGDWGTSNLRLYLFEFNRDDPPKLLAKKTGPGIRSVDDFEKELFSIINAWIKSYGPMPVLLSGMVGSNLGWHIAPYVKCPAPINSWFGCTKTFTTNDCEISILPGLKTINPMGAPDVMRGEELQILGWHSTRTDRTTQDEANTLMLPGTHNKWVSTCADRVENFFTAFTGELFAALKSHSILIAPQSSHSDNDVAFYDGVNHAKNSRDSDSIHLLFSVRSRQIIEELAQNDAASYLSGLIIGSDIKSAIKQFGLQPHPNKAGKELIVIGEPALSKQYQKALSLFDCDTRLYDPMDIALCGYKAMYESIYIH